MSRLLLLAAMAASVAVVARSSLRTSGYAKIQQLSAKYNCSTLRHDMNQTLDELLAKIDVNASIKARQCKAERDKHTKEYDDATAIELQTRLQGIHVANLSRIQAYKVADDDFNTLESAHQADIAAANQTKIAKDLLLADREAAYNASYNAHTAATQAVSQANQNVTDTNAAYAKQLNQTKTVQQTLKNQLATAANSTYDETVAAARKGEAETLKACDSTFGPVVGNSTIDELIRAITYMKDNCLAAAPTSLLEVQEGHGAAARRPECDRLRQQMRRRRAELQNLQSKHPVAVAALAFLEVGEGAQNEPAAVKLINDVKRFAALRQNASEQDGATCRANIQLRTTQAIAAARQIRDANLQTYQTNYDQEVQRVRDLWDPKVLKAVQTANAATDAKRTAKQLMDNEKRQFDNATSIANEAAATLKQEQDDHDSWRNGATTGIAKRDGLKATAQQTYEAALATIDRIWKAATQSARDIFERKFNATNLDCGAFEEEVEREREMVKTFRHHVVQYAHTPLLAAPKNPWCDRDLQGPISHNGASGSASSSCCQIKTMASCVVCLNYTADRGTLRKFCAVEGNCQYDGCSTCNDGCARALPALVNQKANLAEHQALKIFNQSAAGCAEESMAHLAAKATSEAWITLNNTLAAAKTNLTRVTQTCASMTCNGDSDQECKDCAASKNQTQTHVNSLQSQMDTKKSHKEIQDLVALAYSKLGSCCAGAPTAAGCPP